MLKARMGEIPPSDSPQTGAPSHTPALDAARELKPHVELLDIGMPKVTGYDAARRLRQRYGEQCPVLIALTAWKQASDKILANLAGFDHHVAKPYDPNELIRLLEKLQPASR